MTEVIRKLALAGFAFAGLSSAAHAGFAADAWNAFIDTTPAGYARPAAERPGEWRPFWEDTLEGSKRILEEGRNLLVIPTYTNHPRWAWDNRDEQNAYPFGMGLARQVIDERGNERLFFITSFVDSNYRVEPMFGYSWVARWPIGSSGLHWGAGYLAGITMRGDYHWLPCPLPLPVAKIGTDRVSFYGTYIPFTDVLFFYTSISVDDAASHKMPLSPENRFVKNPNLLYGGWGWRYVDNGEEDTSNFMKNDDVRFVGLRHYSGRSWQTDFKFKRSSHDIKVRHHAGTQSIDIDSYSLTIAYNMDVTRDFRLFAGAGAGFARAKSSSGSDHSVHPVMTLGFTWAMTDHLWLTGGMDTSIMRFKGVVDGRGDSYGLRPMPTDFELALGFAF